MCFVNLTYRMLVKFRNAGPVLWVKKNIYVQSEFGTAQVVFRLNEDIA